MEIIADFNILSAGKVGIRNFITMTMNQDKNLYPVSPVCGLTRCYVRKYWCLNTMRYHKLSNKRDDVKHTKPTFVERSFCWKLPQNCEYIRVHALIVH